uniref:Uncharacterized protein n=1 Tax=Nelumbo nucifera TaxID=4432 RepID=A0A822XT01_NELNU|nr:TPA_asm: hypothetical protein HUJ06_023754 [Nelumbo nucifera]
MDWEKQQASEDWEEEEDLLVDNVEDQGLNEEEEEEEEDKEVAPADMDLDAMNCVMRRMEHSDQHFEEVRLSSHLVNSSVNSTNIIAHSNWAGIYFLLTSHLILVKGKLKRVGGRLRSRSVKNLVSKFDYRKEINMNQLQFNDLKLTRVNTR